MTVVRRNSSVPAGIVLLGLAALSTARAGEPTPTLGACGPVPGAFQLPGSDACLRLSGFVAADAGGWQTPAPVSADLAQTVPPRRGLDRSAIGADARLSADVQLPTALGSARVYVSLRARHGVAPVR